MPDKFIMAYVEEERERCAQLCDALLSDAVRERAFLIHCIRYAVQPSEIEERRQRFKEFPNNMVYADRGEGTAEDLM